MPVDESSQPSLASCGQVLLPWVSAQRWCLSSGRGPQLQPLGYHGLGTAAGTPELGIWFFLDGPGRYASVYQVPVVAYRHEQKNLNNAFIATLPEGAAGLWLYDAPHDPHFVDWLMHQLHLADPAGPRQITEHRALSGEQSNSSIIVTLAGSGPELLVIAKIFRVLHPGEHPDVVIPQALARIGSTLVPQPIGSVLGTWPAPETLLPHRPEAPPPAQVSGYLASAQEFLPESPDAWRIATQSVRQGTSFVAQAHELGETVAALHADLRRALPSAAAAEPGPARALTNILLGRLYRATEEVPALADRAIELRALLTAVREVQLPDPQRIHGDLHLGQILHSADRGWRVIDFEGEPLRPMAQRTAADLALRDVAGMLRSFDYAGAHQDPAQPQLAWSTACREAFCLGYAAQSGQDPRTQDTLLRALEVDKAIYEVRYEAAHRPEWLPIPLAAVDRLLTHRPQLSPPPSGRIR